MKTIKCRTARAADALAGRKSSENEFLATIATWYGVTTAEAKFGPIVVLNQASLQRPPWGQVSREAADTTPLSLRAFSASFGS